MKTQRLITGAVLALGVVTGSGGVQGASAQSAHQYWRRPACGFRHDAWSIVQSTQTDVKYWMAYNDAQDVRGDITPLEGQLNRLEMRYGFPTGSGTLASALSDTWLYLQFAADEEAQYTNSTYNDNYARDQALQDIGTAREAMQQSWQDIKAICG